MIKLTEIKILYRHNKLNGANDYSAAEEAVEKAFKGSPSPHIYTDDMGSPLYIFHDKHVLFFGGNVYKEVVK